MNKTATRTFQADQIVVYSSQRVVVIPSIVEAMIFAQLEAK
jgi:hypothetical protein